MLDGDPPVASVASELNAGPQHEFYSYEAKYIDQDGASVDLPAKLDAEQEQLLRDLARLRDEEQPDGELHDVDSGFVGRLRHAFKGR